MKYLAAFLEWNCCRRYGFVASFVAYVSIMKGGVATMVKMSHALATLNSITSLFMVRNIKCGYSFSWLERAEYFETKLEQIW